MKILAASLPLLLLLSATTAGRAWAGTCSLTPTVVTYYSEADKSLFSSDPRCSLVRNSVGTTVCRVAMKGVFYKSPVVRVSGNPTIIWNHGSEHDFNAMTKGCSVAEYFGPLGYHVFVPFRRGQGDIPEACLDPQPTDECEERGHARASTLTCPLSSTESTGKYISQAVDEFVAAGNHAAGSSCTTKGCYKNELFQAQTADIVEAIKWAKTRADVDDAKIAIGGVSYGGIETVLVNSKVYLTGGLPVNAGHAVAIPFSPGADSWATNSGSPNTDLQTMLKDAAAAATRPTFYISPRYDHDTRAAIELAYNHGMRGYDPLHSRPMSLAIFDVPMPADDPCTGEPDWQSVHGSFGGQPEVWGEAVLEFLQRNGIE